MIKKQTLIDYLGGSNMECARRLGYVGYRADNNVNRLPATLSARQLSAIVLRMKARRIKVPKEWK